MCELAVAARDVFAHEGNGKEPPRSSDQGRCPFFERPAPDVHRVKEAIVNPIHFPQHVREEVVDPLFGKIDYRDAVCWQLRDERL
eukprot:scaffold2315_cov399-Pinguiococcus_pyrenoidosus.AAC.1